MAQFAADLSQMVAGRAEPEYQDAGEFFARTS
jgi:predicted AAA+ superfamily ATPase